MPFRFETSPNTPTSNKSEMISRNPTTNAMISSLALLNENNAIPSTRRGNNVPAMISPALEPLDRAGTDWGGNPKIAEARDNLKGLKMGALMSMISMSDVSARAMDSDAEMRAWLGAIEGNTYESGLLKLHVLDVAYADGKALERAVADGTITADDYEYVRSRTREDPRIGLAMERMEIIGRVDRAVANGVMTADEARDLFLLEGFAIDQDTWNSWEPAGASR